MGPQVFLLAVLDHALHANSTPVDRVDLVTKPIAVLSGLSALAPAQRAGAQRLCALAQMRSADRIEQCPHSGVTQTTFAHTEFFSV
jgi:hypothetical protein